MDLINNIPGWLRWILFLPVAGLAAILTYPLIVLLSLLEGLISPYGLNLFTKYSIVIAGSFAQGYVFVRIAAILVPKYRFRISIVLTIFLIVISLMLAFVKFFLANVDFHYTKFESLLSYSSVVMGAILATYHQFQEEKRHSVKIDTDRGYRAKP